MKIVCLGYSQPDQKGHRVFTMNVAKNVSFCNKWHKMKQSFWSELLGLTGALYVMMYENRIEKTKSTSSGTKLTISNF